MFSKKGFAIVFKYMFVAIVGVVILGFFINISRQQFQLGSYKSSTEIAATIDDALEAFSTAPEQADKNFDFGRSLKFYVNKNADKSTNFCNQLSVDQGQAVTYSKIIFAPSTLESNSINIWTKTWFFPFKVGSFFYISSPRIKYHLVYDASTEIIVNQLYSEIPRRFNVERNAINTISNLANAEAPNFDLVKFVFFNTQPNIAVNEKVNTLKVTFDQGSDKQGTLEFNNGPSTFFLSKEMLYGAIFAGSKNSYECSRNLALTKLKFVAGVYSGKVDLLPFSNIEGTCDKYPIISENLRILKDTQITQSNYQSIYGNINTLKNVNREAAGSGECVAVF